ncbi:type IV secretory system conjugative DNA transfer family protein [Kordiimonas sp.]|uniref:type IV secretory system conjugative DNA transfer family protein n=1 Tax=Kordiimonas sp. TaxID=1970157 RepID=UPI003A923013
MTPGAFKILAGFIIALSVVIVMGETDADSALAWVVVGMITLWLLSYAFGTSMLSVLWSFMSGIGRGMVATSQWAFSTQKPSATFMGFFERFRFFGGSHKGFLVDGHKKRLNERLSFQSLIAVGGMGMGKSSIFVMPNLFTLDDCSIVVSDSSGEIYEQTSGYLASKGYDIKVFNLMQPERSELYNPLAGDLGYMELAQAANLIVRSALDGGGEQSFWNAGAEKIIRILIQCLRNRNEPEYCNLANLLYLLNNFDAHVAECGGRLDRFVVESTLTDPATYADYKGFVNAGNEKTVLSFLSTATTALSAVGNPDIARLTSQSSFAFSDLRKRKTALYVLARQQDLRFYSFLLNLFYTELFNELLSERNPAHLPIYCLLDEFGHLTIPNFDIVASTARKYRIAIWSFIQSMSQMESRYGELGAKTIQDSFGTHIYLPGVGLDTAKALERRLGKVQIPMEQGGEAIYRAENLMEESEIIQMQGHEALLIHANQKPVKLQTRPFYEQAGMVRKSKMEPYPLLRQTSNDAALIRF